MTGIYFGVETPIMFMVRLACEPREGPRAPIGIGCSKIGSWRFAKLRCPPIVR
jgi:hypothetical protein